MNRRVFSRYTALALLVMASSMSAGCADPGNGENGASCRKMVNFQNRDYWEIGDVEFHAGERLGETHLNPCNDTGRSEEPGGSLVVYEAVGISAKIAVAVKNGQGMALYSTRDDGGFPPQVRDLIEKSRK
ncbi:DUF6281 family protein [Streptomyces sp. NPDC006784]|uniref:DUF6281 family protein n=1 Tax=Streptomyces sp. NPDC006784 TaxID=3364764 RepID=UPI00368DB83B